MKAECKSGEGFIAAENVLALPLETGQMVEVETPGISLFSQALAAFLPPGLGFIAAFILTRLLFPQTGEAAAAFMGVIFLFAAAFVVYRVRKKYPAKCEYSVSRIIG